MSDLHNSKHTIVDISLLTLQIFNSSSQNISIDDIIAYLKPVCEWNHTISVCLTIIMRYYPTWYRRVCIPCLPRPIFNYLILYSVMYLIYYCQNLSRYIMFWISSAQNGLSTIHCATCLHSNHNVAVINEHYSITN